MPLRPGEGELAVLPVEAGPPGDLPLAQQLHPQGGGIPGQAGDGLRWRLAQHRELRPQLGQHVLVFGPHPLPGGGAPLGGGDHLGQGGQALEGPGGCRHKALGAVGELFFNYGFLAYLAVAICLAASYFLKRTRPGLNLRAVGEDPATADAAGIDVTRYKYKATCIGCMIAGLGGLYYVMDYANGIWSNDAFGDRGWLAIALVIFTMWRPAVSILAGILFGGLYILHLFLPSGTNLAVKELYKMLPYLVTIAVLIIVSLKKSRENQPPAHLGLSYFREER